MWLCILDTLQEIGTDLIVIGANKSGTETSRVPYGNQGGRCRVNTRACATQAGPQGSWTMEDAKSRRMRMFGNLKDPGSQKILGVERPSNMKAPRLEGL